MPLFQYLWQAGVPLSLFIVIVTALLYYWPRPAKVLLNRTRRKVQIISVKEISPDTKRIRFSLGAADAVLGVPVGKYITVYAPNPGKCLSTGVWNGQEDPDNGAEEINRTYTPILGDETVGYSDIVVKIYRPGTTKMADGKQVTWEDGGKVGLYLDSKQPGDYIDINGPLGMIEYLGKGMFRMPNKTVCVHHVGMLAGGSGITPMFQILKASLKDQRDACKFSLIYANKTESDILLRDELDQMVKDSNGRFKIHYTLDFPPTDWKHRVGFIAPEMIRSFLPPPKSKPLLIMCGPPPMMSGACRNNLEVLGYPSSTMFVL